METEFNVSDLFFSICSICATFSIVYNYYGKSKFVLIPIKVYTYVHTMDVSGVSSEYGTRLKG